MAHLYPHVEVARQSFKNVQKVTVPKQSLSLREIIKRFVRRESLPVLKEGVYEERFGDLEKLSKADITVQMEKVEEIRQQLLNIEKKFKEQQAAKEKAATTAAQSSTPAPTTPAGGTPNQTPPLQGS